MQVRYRITSRRVSVTSGIGGNDVTEVIYPDIQGLNFVFRSFGATGDMVSLDGPLNANRVMG
jgi:hypothetical protein